MEKEDIFIIIFALVQFIIILVMAVSVSKIRKGVEYLVKCKEQEMHKIVEEKK